MPKISVVISLYNKEKHIKETLNSVLEQTFKDFEVIVVNDGSTDESMKVAKSLNDERIQFYTIENQGVSHARNYGIEKSGGDLIAFLDADDYWHPNHLENLCSLHLDFPGCGLYATAYTIDKKDRMIVPQFKDMTNISLQTGIVPDYFQASCINAIAWTSAVMVPKAVLESIGKFDESITLGAGEDTDLWLRIALKHPVAISNTATAIYNMKATNRISNSNTNERQFMDLDKYEPQTTNRPSLKKYLDLNRFSIGIQYLLADNPEKAKDYFKKIDKKSLNSKQQILIKLPRPLLRTLARLQDTMSYFNIKMSPFR